MKIRSDFVTNSSGSSFIIAVKEELTKEKLYKIFRVSDDHPLRDIADTILERAEKITEDELVQDRAYAVNDDKRYNDIFGKGYILYAGYVSDCSSPAENYLLNFSLNLPEEDFIFFSDY